VYNITLSTILGQPEFKQDFWFCFSADQEFGL